MNISLKSFLGKVLCALSVVFLCSPPIATAQEPGVSTAPKKPIECDGLFKGGGKPNEEKLKQILAAHTQWVDSIGTDGKQANLCEADLREAQLPEVFLGKANLTGATLTGAHLTGATLTGATLSGAHLTGATLSGAHLTGAHLFQADLTLADLTGADLTGADLSRANLEQADLRRANLSNARLIGTKLNRVRADFVNFGSSFFEPESLNDIVVLGASGLSTIRFENPRAVVKLRKSLRDSTLRNEERALTSALRKYQLNADPSFMAYVEWSLFGGWLTDFGANPQGSLKALIYLLFLFAFFYLIPLVNPGRGTAAIWVMWPKEGVPLVLDDKSPNESGQPSERTMTQDDGPITQEFFFPRVRNWLTSKLNEKPWGYRVIDPFELFALILGSVYFSLLSAFRLGWRDLNVGTWISRLQPRIYNLQATGWVRSLSGIQSLISVYLIAMWVLTYFGRPFE
ncbi:MAG: pentapeptide repeat-containing protein [Nitrospinae bacterium]|nr:pentapeptide repeat-containing protein [Nitrospinota bacterium]